MGLRDTIRAAGRGMTNARATETSKAEADEEDQTDNSAEADEENEDMATAESDAEEDGGEDDGGNNEDKDSGARVVRMSERGRIRSILGCSDAGSSPDLAMELAFETDMSAAAAQNLLKAAAKSGGPKASNLGGRMKTEGNPKLGAGGEDEDAALTDKAEGRLLSLAKARKAQRSA